jgi:hypothetical protein
MPGPISPESVSTILNYFSPTKSPYYTVGLAACVALALACDVTSHGQWLSLSIPAFLVAVLTFVLSLDSENTLTREEHAEQLRFARSTCISVSVIALGWGGEFIATSGGAVSVIFPLNVSMCCFQISLFLLYSWALNKRDLLGSDHNYVQLTLLTSAFLGDTSYNLSQATNPKDTGNLHHLWTAYALGLLWVGCIIFWIWKLATLGIVRRPGSLDAVQADKPTGVITTPG